MGMVGAGAIGTGIPKGGGEAQAAELEAEVVGPELSPEAIEAARAVDASHDSDGRIDELLAEVAGLRRELADAKSASDMALRRAEIGRALTEAGAIDLEITTPLVEEAMGEMEEADVGKAVREIRASKAFLFRAPPAMVGGRGALMAGASSAGGLGLDELAGDARSTGDRSDLLRYLRARRS